MKTRHTNRGNKAVGRSPCAGFSLVEATISMTLSVLLLGGMTVLYYGAAKTVHREEVKNEASESARMLENNLTKDLTLVGLWATEDIDGDSNDIDGDVPNMTWSDSLFEAFEFCNSYTVMFTADVDNDSVTEAVILYANNDDELSVWERVFEWDRDSSGWAERYVRRVATGVEHLLIRYYDNEGTELPNGYPPSYYSGGHTLTRGERTRVAMVELVIVSRSDHVRNGDDGTTYTIDGWYVRDAYEHTKQSFMVRGRNLQIDS